MNRRTATLLGLLPTPLWSCSIAFERLTAESLGPLGMAAATNLIGGLVLLGISASLPNRSRPPLRRYLLLVSLFMPCAIFFALAVGLASSRLQVVEVSLINYLWPVLTLFTTAVVQRRPIRALAFPATIVALLGIVLVTTGGEFSLPLFAERIAAEPAPYAAGFLSALCWAAYSAINSVTSQGSTQTTAELITLTGFAALALVLFCEPTREPIPLAVTAGAASCLAGGYALWDVGTRLGDENIVIGFSYMLPLFSVIVTSWILSVPITGTMLVGAALLVAGAFFSSHSARAE